MSQLLNFAQRAVSQTSSTSKFHRWPKLSVSVFNGDILQWQTFWDSFESTIHLNVDLTDVQKFSYLKTQIEANAARTIDGYIYRTPLKRVKRKKTLKKSFISLF